MKTLMHIAVLQVAQRELGYIKEDLKHYDRPGSARSEMMGWCDAIAELVEAVEVGKPVTDDLYARLSPGMQESLEDGLRYKRPEEEDTSPEAKAWREADSLPHERGQGRFWTFMKMTQLMEGTKS